MLEGGTRERRGDEIRGNVEDEDEYEEEDDSAMKGRYCVKTDDGFWLRVRRGIDGKRDAAEHIRDPKNPQGATSFFSAKEAEAARVRFGLPNKEEFLELMAVKTEEEWLEAKRLGWPVVHRVVDDPNP